MGLSQIVLFGIPDYKFTNQIVLASIGAFSTCFGTGIIGLIAFPAQLGKLGRLCSQPTTEMMLVKGIDVYFGLVVIVALQ